jgi:putative DNA primase/helicase
MAAAERLLRNESVVKGETLNRDPWLLNCANGTVDLRTGAMREHRKADYLTTCVPLDYNPGAKSPLWEETLRDIYIPEVLRFVQEWFGYCITGSVREQKFVAHWGGGDNGKSTVLDVVMDIAGPLGLTASADLFTQRRFGGSETSVMAATLFGKRIAVAHETDATASLREALIKQLTGGDKIAGRRLYQDAFDFTPTHSLNLITNHPPQIQGTDEGIWRRVVLLPYLSRFGDAQDVAEGRATHLKDPLRMERLKGEREGILAWLVEGARRWYERGYLEIPKSVKAASLEYREGEDRIGAFCREHVAVVPGAEFKVSGYIPSNETNAYKFYRGWCADAGYLPLSASKFRAEMLTRCPIPRWQQNSNGGLYLEGLKLVNWQNAPSAPEDLARLLPG